MKNKPNKLLSFWPLFFLLVSLEAAVALFSLVRIPAEGTGGILGFSALRWVLLSPLIVISILSGIIAVFTWRNGNFSKEWLDPSSRPRLYDILLILFPILGATTGIFSFLLRWYDPGQFLPVFERAWPLLVFLILLTLQSWIWLSVMKFGFHWKPMQAFKPGGVTFLVFMAVFFFIGATRLGITPDPAYWGEPGVPIQGWQFGLALLGGVLFMTLNLLPGFKPDSKRYDLWIGVLIWTLAAGIWLSVPIDVLKNSFYFPIDPPLNLPLPYSDSGYYDYMAHSLLIGTDYTGQIPTRPLYIVFLSILHLVLGERYDLIILGQSLVLALIPVLFYTLGKKIHSRTAGFTIALLAIFREWTSLLVSSDTRVSNTKILLVDTPTLMLILLGCLFAVRWLNRKDHRSAFAAGGVFGILLLLRTQSMLILPILLLIAVLALKTDKRPWLLPSLLFLLGIGVSILPWLTHNYLRIGSFAFDAPFQYKVLASQYAYTGNLDFNAVDLENKSLSQILITFALRDPGFVAGFISNHFLATQIGAMLALPLFFPFYGLRAPVNLYWTAYSFEDILVGPNLLLIVFYLAIIALGLGAAWRRWRWIGLVPLTFNLGYALANGIGRFSGWRYDLPADWIAYFYFGIGFAEFIIWLSGLFRNRTHLLYTQEPSAPRAGHTTFAHWLFLTAGFALIGFLPWGAELVSSPRYPERSATEIQAEITSVSFVEDTGVSVDEIRAFAAQPTVVTLSGRLLYPRFFPRNSGLTSTTPWPSYAPRDFPRLGFKLLNQSTTEVILPIKNTSFGNIQGADVLILGCKREAYLEARLLVFPQEKLAYLSSLELEPCSATD